MRTFQPLSPPPTQKKYTLGKNADKERKAFWEMVSRSVGAAVKVAKKQDRWKVSQNLVVMALNPQEKYDVASGNTEELSRIVNYRGRSGGASDMTSTLPVLA